MIEPLGRVVACLDRHEDRQAEPDCLGFDQRHGGRDHAVGAESLNSPPARGLGQPDPGSDVGDGERGVLLKDRQDSPVHII